jgi:hypothetical protein
MVNENEGMPQKRPCRRDGEMAQLGQITVAAAAAGRIGNSAPKADFRAAPLNLITLPR